MDNVMPVDMKFKQLFYLVLLFMLIIVGGVLFYRARQSYVNEKYRGLCGSKTCIINVAITCAISDGNSPEQLSRNLGILDPYLIELHQMIIRTNGSGEVSNMRCPGGEIMVVKTYRDGASVYNIRVECTKHNVPQ